MSKAAFVLSPYLLLSLVGTRSAPQQHADFGTISQPPRPLLSCNTWNYPRFRCASQGREKRLRTVDGSSWRPNLRPLRGNGHCHPPPTIAASSQLSARYKRRMPGAFDQRAPSRSFGPSGQGCSDRPAFGRPQSQYTHTVSGYRPYFCTALDRASTFSGNRYPARLLPLVTI